MVVYAPWQLEMLGAGDIAAPPPMDAISRLYGFIPVNRGNLDRAALTKALSALQQGGILGLFPEGGIWDPGAMEAKRGVAWLSYQSRAPILPIGFGSPDGALRDTLRLKRPALSMTVGKLIPPVDLPKGSPRHEALQRAAVDILDAVDRLIPEPFRQQRMAIADERFELGLRVLDGAGQPLTIPPSLAIVHSDGLCKVFYRPAILRIFAKDLHLPVAALQHLDQDPSPEALVSALSPVPQYITDQNPGFFPLPFRNGERPIDGGRAPRTPRAGAVGARRRPPHADPAHPTIPPRRSGRGDRVSDAGEGARLVKQGLVKRVW